MNAFVRIIMMTLAWICFLAGCIGIFVPVLPTTPLVLLATFLFTKSSPRCQRYIESTKVYKYYVSAFKDAGGIPRNTKIRILAISYTVMGISAYFVQKPLVWGVLLCVSVFLMWLMMVHIPTISAEKAQTARAAYEEI